MTQNQSSLTDQLWSLVVIANKNGLYDAADFIRNTLEQPSPSAQGGESSKLDLLSFDGQRIRADSLERDLADERAAREELKAKCDQMKRDMDVMARVIEGGGYK